MKRPREDSNTGMDTSDATRSAAMNATADTGASASASASAADADNNDSAHQPAPAAKKEKRTHKEQGRSKNRALAGDVKPQKKFYRSRAHCNPLSHNDSFNYPVSPNEMSMQWNTHFPQAETATDGPDFVDMGCGFGGLTVALATAFPDRLTLGMEIRAKVVEYVHLRILSLRKANPGMYNNASVLRTNGMKYLPNFFRKKSLTKMFFCFPDPHFKAKNHRRRIISPQLLTEYAYCMKDGGLLYTITDVQELHEWMVRHCTDHCAFKRLTDEELKDDLAIPLITESTEEGQKASRNKKNENLERNKFNNTGSKHVAVFRKLSEAEIVTEPFFNLQKEGDGYD